MADLIHNYYSYIDERDQDNPSIGLTLSSEKPTFEEEAAWFYHLFTAVRKGSTRASVAEVDGHAVGLVAVSEAGSHSESAHVGTLGIALHKAHRGKGIGRVLLNDVIRKCIGRFEVIRLTVFETNERALKLYASLGFVSCGKIPKAVKRQGTYYDEYLMTLDLGQK